MVRTIEKIRLVNFKALRDATLIFKPLIFLVGKNSSGKSSLLQALLLLKQTVLSRDRTAQIVMRGDHVDLGGYRDFVFRHDIKLPVTIELLINLEKESSQEHYPSYFMWGGGLAYKYFRNIDFDLSKRPEINAIPKRIWISITYSYTRPETTVISEIRYFDEKRKPILIARRKSARHQEDIYDLEFFYSLAGKDIRATIHGLSLRKFAFYRPGHGMSEDNSIIFRFFGKSIKKNIPQKKLNYAMVGYILSISEYISHLLESLAEQIIHLGPIREKPNRMYIDTGEKDEHVEPTGRDAVEMLYALRKKRGQRYAEKEIEGRILYWLKKLDLANAFAFKMLRESSAFLFRLRNQSLSLLSSIADHGFGLSQILPVIVEGFHERADSILLLEQPEIHLHPKAQADLAEMLKEISLRNEKIIIAETHSVHLIERMQLLIAKDPSLRAKIGINLFDLKKDGTNITELELTSEGRRINWPKYFSEGFLENGFNDAFEQEMIIAKRYKKTK